MIYRVEVFLQGRFRDAHADGVLGQVRELGIDSIVGARHYRLFFLFGDLGEPEALRASRELLADPVTEGFNLLAIRRPGPGDDRPGGGKGHGRADAVIEVHLKSGVMDPVAASTEQAIRDMGLKIEQVRTARRYELLGRITPPQRETIARRLLANDCIEDVHFGTYTPPETHGLEYKLQIHEVPIRELDDEGLTRLSRQRDLFLSATEMQAIREHY